MTQPISFSVVIPLFNKAPFVVEAVESVLQQSYPASEIIVIDDGSTDGGPDLVRRLFAPRLSIVSQENAGVSAARNRGIDIASGDYIAFLDADDRYSPDFLAKIAELITRFPAAGMACAAYTCVWNDGRREDRTLHSAQLGESFLVQDFYSSWARSSFTSTISLAVARKLLDERRLRFPIGEKLGEDQDLWFRVAESAPVAYTNISLANYRMEVQGSATQNSVACDVLPCYRRLEERLVKKLVPVHMVRGARRLLATHLLYTARANLNAGNRKKAAEFLSDYRALANPLYFLRTLMALVWCIAKKHAKP